MNWCRFSPDVANRHARKSGNRQALSTTNRDLQSRHQPDGRFWQSRLLTVTTSRIIRRAERRWFCGASHLASPIVGLHCRTKGANRTILDCVFCLLGKD